MAAAELRDQLQKTLGDAYTIQRELSGGGMSRVFVAEERSFGRPVVVKTLSPEYAGAVSAERFRREIRVAASLQQANIVPVHSAGEIDGLPYYTMPFVEGESLRAHIAKNGSLSVSDTLRIVNDIARALAYAHDRGVVHRDIKPENVLLSGSTAVVTDFGIAKALEASRTNPGTSSLTQLGVMLGTPRYMAPEQVSGDPNVDQRADIYSLGIIAYELLTGAPPFTDRPLQAMLAAHVVEPPVPVRERRPDVGAPLGALVMRCLSKNPDDRPQNGGDLLRALESATRSTVLGPPVLAAPRPKPMIAVLAFTNMSAHGDDEYFSDGMTEDIITHLSQIASIQVISRTSAMRYKKSDLSAREIAAKLGASHVVEGSVRRAANRLRIVAQLVEASTDAHLWARTFDRDIVDVFALQTEVAEQIAAALWTRLAPEERRRIACPPTEDQEAYNLFLLARHHANLVTADGLERATDFYRRAVARDPLFARAWAALAQSQLFHVAGYYGVPPRVAAEQVREYAARALAVNPDIAEAHAALGMLASSIDLDPETARLHHVHALSLAPNLASVHLLHGNALIGLGHFGEAVESARQALELDPASEYVHVHANWLRYATGRFDDALAGLEAAEAQFGRRVIPLTRGATLISMGRAAETVESFRELYENIPISWNLGHLAWSLAAAGRDAEARATLAKLHAAEDSEYVWPQAIALAYANLGEMDDAFRYLDRCHEDRAAWIQWPYTRTFDLFRGDPRFDTLVKKIGAIVPTS